MNYQAPTISSAKPLGVTLATLSDQQSDVSDAEVKHGVEPIAYEAPEISDARELSGTLFPISQDR